jgi:single-stranded DNA-binding protein
VATLPEKKNVRGTGRIYFEFRAAESSKGSDPSPTWFTVRAFDEAPEVAKGDFLKITGKLKQDVFTGRDGKPMGVLVVMAYSCERLAKPTKARPDAAPPATATPRTIESQTSAAAKPALGPSAPATAAEEQHPSNNQDEVDQSWLELVAS